MRKPLKNFNLIAPIFYTYILILATHFISMPLKYFKSKSL